MMILPTDIETKGDQYLSRGLDSSDPKSRFNRIAQSQPTLRGLLRRYRAGEPELCFDWATAAELGASLF
jgi:hypothetical protein